jgi:hypothetical protein
MKTFWIEEELLDADIIEKAEGPTPWVSLYCS